MKRPTIRDVAAKAGVSTATVSYVLNGTGSVSPATANRVRECVDELGYRANGLAVAHRTGRSRTIGLAVRDLTNPFFPEFAQGVHRAAAAEGYSVLLIDAHDDDTDELENLDRFADRLPEGLIWTPIRRNVIADRHLPFPVVVYDRQVDGFDSVQADIRAGGALQAQALLDHGHHRVGVISGPEWSDTGRLRRRGLLQRLAGHAEVVWEFPLSYSSEIPADVASQILRHDDVTCIVTANDIQAIGVLRLLSSHGRDVPGDVSVIGFDDIALASLVTPSLTTVRLSTRVLGATAFEVLIARIREPETPIRRECVDVTLVERESLRTL